jgi:predicted metalloprotease
MMPMEDQRELVIEDFTSVTRHIEEVLDQINKIFKSSSLTEEEKEELGRIGRSIYGLSHELDHLFLDLEGVAPTLREALQDYYGH